MDSLFATEITRPTIQMFFQRSLNTFFTKAWKVPKKKLKNNNNKRENNSKRKRTLLCYILTNYAP